MKIVDIQAAGFSGASPKGGWSTEIQPDDCFQTLIKVRTDEGVTGLGSVFTSEALVKAALLVLEQYYIGKNPLEPERLSEILRQNTFWVGRGGSVEHTISGIDIALWDIFGKVCKQPIGTLLGGRYRDKVRAYASILMDEPEILAENMTRIKEMNFKSFKIGWGPFGRVSYAKDEEIVKAARDAVGSECMLMVDAGGSDAFWPNGFKWAKRTAEMLEDYQVEWFEEPLKPDALEDYIRLRNSSSVPISGGEVFTRRQSFLPWLKAGALDIVQPDVTKVGGISESRRIAYMAEDFGVKFIPHGWNTAVGLATDLQLASAFPGTTYVEYLIGSPYIDDITTTHWELDENGMLEIPTQPGHGLELDTDMAAIYISNKDFLN